jgi:hypothetical protein
MTGIGTTLSSPRAPAKVLSPSYLRTLRAVVLLTIGLVLKELTIGVSVAAWLVH